MFANSQLMGVDTAFPDVCLTPAPSAPAPIPVPYLNVATGPMAIRAAYHVLYMCTPAHNMSSTIPLTNGDNPGVAMGVAAGTVMGSSRHVTGALTCLVGGMPATRMTSVTLQNSTNCPGARTVPSQIKVLVLAP